jgi:hypothetical protein
MRMRPWLLLLAVSAMAPARTLIVSPQGPLKSLAEARDAIRALRQQGADEAFLVQVRAGTYRLSEPFVLAPEDSGAPGKPVVYEAYPGERPLISGGRPLPGTLAAKGHMWTAQVAQGSNFHQLFVGGRRARRARTPNNGFLRAEGPSSQDKPYRLNFRGADVKPEWAEPGDVDVVVLLSWAELRMPIVSVDKQAGVAVLAGDPMPSNQERDARYYIENAPDALDEAGEWRLDRKTGTVSYRAASNENMLVEEVVAPVLAQLVRLEGRPEQGRYVRNVVFRGLEFSHTDWTMGPKGVAEPQASVGLSAAFEAVGAEECVIERCVFSRLGNYAIEFGRGSRRNRIVGNEIRDIGAGGIKIGERGMRDDERERNFEQVVTDNHLHDLGLVFPSAVGILVGQSSRNTISHNHIHDLYYTAISVGWTWGYTPNQCNGNIVEYNHLHHVGREMLSDMGAIYTLGVQPGTRIRYNLIHDVRAFTYGGWGIYPDEGSSEMLIENNVVYRTKSSGFHQHYGRENIVRNNVFAFNDEFQLIRSRIEPHVSFTFENNIVIFDSGRLLGTNWGDSKFVMKNNLYWDTRGGAIGFGKESWDEWRARGMDAGSAIADPLFVDAANYDFRLRPDSPVLKLGFRPIDMSGVGPRPQAR